MKISKTDLIIELEKSISYIINDVQEIDKAGILNAELLSKINALKGFIKDIKNATIINE
tara:strand:- start:43 stop:219 length:177 start_codon:yes stop_codon:yes gene_type:complete